MAATFRDILQDRTHKYRRSLLGITLLLIAIYYFVPEAKFERFAIFGVNPLEGSGNARLLVLSALWLAWLYHVFLFRHFAFRDWKDWRYDLLQEDDKTEAFGEIGMYFGRAPGELLTKRKFGHKAVSGVWSRNNTSAKARWKYSYRTRQDEEGVANLTIPLARAQSVRSRIRWYVGVDWGFPVALSILALVLAVQDVPWDSMPLPWSASR